MKNEEACLNAVVVDDHSLVLEGLKSLLGGLPAIRHIEAVRTGHELLEKMARQTFDIYLLDVELPDMDGLALVDAIRRQQPQAKIVVNTMHEEIWTIRRLAEARVDGVVFKTSDPGHVLRAVTAATAGEKYFCPKFEKLLHKMDRTENGTAAAAETPSPRELDVLRAMAKGYSTVEISHLLFISENTVETHRKNLMQKFGARNATDLVLRALAKGYLTLPIE